MIICGIGGRLNDKNILAADIFLDLDKYLHISKPPYAGLGKGQIEVAANCLRQRAVAIARKKLHSHACIVVGCTMSYATPEERHPHLAPAPAARPVVASEESDCKRRNPRMPKSGFNFPPLLRETGGNLPPVAKSLLSLHRLSGLPAAPNYRQAVLSVSGCVDRPRRSLLRPGR